MLSRAALDLKSRDCPNGARWGEKVLLLFRETVYET